MKMAWGKKKVANVITPEQLEAQDIKQQISNAPVQPQPQPQPIVQPVQQPTSYYAKVMEGAEIAENVYKFVVISNKSIGEIGSTFSLDD